MKIRPIVLALFSLSSFAAHSADPGVVQGHATLALLEDLDAAVLTIEGEAARALYDGMGKVRIVREEFGNGSYALVRTGKNIACTVIYDEGAEKYGCMVGFEQTSRGIVTKK